MNEKDKIEITRNILNKAININMSRTIILKISQKLDEYIVDYYRKIDGEKQKDERSAYPIPAQEHENNL